MPLLLSNSFPTTTLLGQPWFWDLSSGWKVGAGDLTSPVPKAHEACQLRVQSMQWRRAGGRHIIPHGGRTVEWDRAFATQGCRSDCTQTLSNPFQLAHLPNSTFHTPGPHYSTHPSTKHGRSKEHAASECHDGSCHDEKH